MAKAQRSFREVHFIPCPFGEEGRVKGTTLPKTRDSDLHRDDGNDAAKALSKSGVTIAICAHNAAQRLPQTLAHLVRQSAPGVEWEVLLVDNASTDGTAEVARACWPLNQSAGLRVAHEPMLGVAYARRLALLEARYEFVSFVDDDNWVEPGWVQFVFETLNLHRQVAAVSGLGVAASDGPLPDWFESFQDNYAVGPSAPAAGEIAWSRGSFFTAGTAFRKTAVLPLFSAGFRFQLSGRKGAVLSAGEDTELCFALRLAGWRFWYEPRLRFTHFLPQRRLQWSYLRQLWHGFGQADPVHDFYRNALNVPTTWRMRLGQHWAWRAMHALKLAWWTYSPLMRLGQSGPGSRDELLHVFHRARFRELLRLRGRYDAGIIDIRQAAWLRPPAERA